MFDKIVIVLAASSLLRNSQTEMPATEACWLASPLACLLRTYFDSCSPLPGQIRKDRAQTGGRKLSASISANPPFWPGPGPHFSAEKELWNQRESTQAPSDYTPNTHTHTGHT